MVQNVKRVVDILSKQPAVNPGETAKHDKVLELVLLEGVEDIKELTESILKEYSSALGGDEYWVPLFETFVTANYDRAQQVVIALGEGLNLRRFTACNRAYPSAIVGILNAAVWHDEHGWKSYEEFLRRLPRDLANMLIAYADASSTKEVRNSDLNMWLIGQFTQALSKYLRPKSGEGAWYRMKEFSAAIMNVQNIGSPSIKLMSEVTMGLLHIMPQPTSMKVVATALYTSATERLAREEPENQLRT
ncbi:hypothetical protein K8R03_02875 [Candidatus Kaiserbacteria bacterium]|nr:hypothetical protein [Candidatus Kaiserbacteria bacterium]